MADINTIGGINIQEIAVEVRRFLALLIVGICALFSAVRGGELIGRHIANKTERRKKKAK